ncbi:hypothetical protein ACVSQB_42400, partial [Bradyrhizobium elkanii]
HRLTNSAADSPSLTHSARRGLFAAYETLKEAEDFLADIGFRLVPDSCDWRNAAGDDAGCYAVEGGGYSVKIGGRIYSARLSC